MIPAGDNQPPDDIDPLRERLNETYADIVVRLNDLVRDSNTAEAAQRRIGLVAATERVIDFAIQCRVCRQTLKEAHDNEKRPFLEAGRVVDRWHSEFAERLAIVERAALARIKSDLETSGELRIRTGMGGVASLKSGHPKFHLSAEHVDWLLIAQFLDQAALDKAIHACIKATGEPPAGVEIIETREVHLA